MIFVHYFLSALFGRNRASVAQLFNHLLNIRYIKHEYR